MSDSGEIPKGNTEETKVHIFTPGAPIKFADETRFYAEFKGSEPIKGYISKMYYQPLVVDSKAIARLTDDYLSKVLTFDKESKEYSFSITTDLKLEPVNENSILEITGHVKIQREKKTVVREKKWTYDGSCAWFRWENREKIEKPDRFVMNGKINGCFPEWLKPEARTFFEYVRWHDVRDCVIRIDLPMSSAYLTDAQMDEAIRRKDAMFPVRMPEMGGYILLIRRESKDASYRTALLKYKDLLDGKIYVQAVPGVKMDTSQFMLRIKKSTLSGLKWVEVKDEEVIKSA